MAVAIPSLPMTGSSLKTSLDLLRQSVPFKVGSVAELQGLNHLVPGDRCLLPQGAFEIVSGLGLPASETVIDIANGDLQAVLAAGEPLANVDAVLADTRSAAFFESGLCLCTHAEGFVYDVANASATDQHVQTAGGVKLYVRPGESGFNVRAFGARGDGSTDDSAAISKAFRAAAASRVMPTTGNNPVVLNRIYFPGGEYIVGTPRSMMDRLAAGRSVGLTYEGDAAGTTIHFAHDGDDYLFFNDNEFMLVRFKNLFFTCDSDTSKFMFVNASGGAQEVLFDNCNWAGVWQKLYRLEGGNNNSEWKWSNCGVTASIRDVMLDIPSEGSDQFLNYWFTNCRLWLYDGQCIRARKGGHFHFVNCDWSGLAPGMTLNTSTNGAPLFELLGTTHARGVCSLTVTGGRFEHKNTNSKLIYCQWPYGTVSFRDVDFGAVIPAGYDSVVHAEFRVAGMAGPMVLFDNCFVIGQHKYFNASGSQVCEHNARYLQCQINQPKPDDFLIFDRDIIGGTWLVELDRCRSSTNHSSGNVVVWDAVYGSRYAVNSHFGKRSFVFRDTAGRGTPTTTAEYTAKLPAEAIITRVVFRNTGDLPAGTSTEFELRDGNGTVIAAAGSQAPDSRWAVVVEEPYLIPAGFEDVVIVDSLGTADQRGTTLFVEVEFIC
ncbi:glycosyl hydrolase family 28-related protein [Primorskyibacter sp. 2E107]|uniref:glycosyl hydrolase family 28-related protein n=1 Tax=Primorskyibacter sp. 2E107 TaxID=3403458 RepID=UPI003AF5AB64